MESITIRPLSLTTKEEQERAFDLGKLLSVLWARKYLVLVTSLLVFAPAAVATFTATPEYISTVTLQVDPNPASVVPFTDLAVSPVANYEFFMKTQDEILRTGVMASRVRGASGRRVNGRKNYLRDLKGTSTYGELPIVS